VSVEVNNLKKDIRKLKAEELKLISPFTRFKYIKLTILAISIISAYYLFNQPFFEGLAENLNAQNSLGIFVAGILIAFGFTAPFSIGLFLISNVQNIFLSALIGALGALFADMLIFRIIKYSFTDEFEALRKTAAAKKLKHLERHLINPHIRHYLAYALAGLAIASPLPDEIGVTMLAGLNTINAKVLAIMSFMLHFIGILTLIAIGRAI
jgi:hypothetical protein